MIEAAHLTRRFGRLTAVDRVTFRVGIGEVVALLGPNGAGKTTTMRMLAGFLPPSAGSAHIAGHDVARGLAARRALGFLPEGAPLYPEMTPDALLRFAARLRGLGPGSVGRALDLTQLGAVRAQPIGTLSKGFRRRVGLAMALLHDPPALVLDEPTDGLDPNQKRDIRALVTAMAPTKAIVVSTHLLEEVEAICTRALVIARGRIVWDGPAGRLAGQHPSGRLDAAFAMLTQ